MDEKDNTYVLPIDSEELGRLVEQGRYLTKATGGLFPERAVKKNSHVLDIACGPGDWANGMANDYHEQGVQVTGIDISPLQLAYARMQAITLGLDNSTFTKMDALSGLAFPDASFDIVNSRCILSFMRKDDWPVLLKEIVRITRPGGVIRLVELDANLVSAPACEQLGYIVAQAFCKADKNFSPHGYTTSVAHMLKYFLKVAGVVQTHSRADLLDYSYGEEYFPYQRANVESIIPRIKPFVVAQGVCSSEEFDRLHEQAITEMRQPDFCGLVFCVTVWGKKPKKK